MRRMTPTDIVISSDDRIAVTSYDDRIMTSDRSIRRRSRASAPAQADQTATSFDGRGTAPSASRLGSGLKMRIRRAIPRLHLTLLQKMAAGGVAATAILVGGAILWHSGVIQRTADSIGTAILDTTAQAGFRIVEITVSGRGRTTPEQIMAALDSRHGDPILGLDLQVVKDRLEALPSVKAAAVERRLPSTLHLAIVEREPVAIWQNNGQHLLVDRFGHIIPGTVAGFEDLPLVVGDGAGIRADTLLSMLATEPDLAPRVKAAIRVSNRRWNLMLDDANSGLEIRLPEDDDAAEAAWHRIAQLEHEHSLAGRAVSMVDMRLPDRLILKTERPASAAENAKSRGNGA